MANCNTKSSLKSILKKNVTALIFAVAFFCYFASESLLRQAAAGKMASKGMSIDTVVNKLPEGIRENIQRKIELCKLRTDLKNVKTPEERIFALIALGNALSEKDLELAYAEVLDTYPTHPNASQAYTHFLLPPKKSIRKVSLRQFREFISKVPDTERLQLWNAAYTKMIDNNLPSSQIFEFFSHMIKDPPPFKDYKPLYIELAEIAFLDKKSDLNLKYKNLSAKCDSLPTILEIISQKEKQKRTNKKKKKKERPTEKKSDTKRKK